MRLPRQTIAGAGVILLGMASNASAMDYSITVIDVPGASAGTTAVGINNSGQIVGSFGDNTGTHGFLYNGGKFTVIDGPGALGANIYGLGYTEATGHTRSYAFFPRAREGRY